MTTIRQLFDRLEAVLAAKGTLGAAALPLLVGAKKAAELSGILDHPALTSEPTTTPGS